VKNFPKVFVLRKIHIMFQLRSIAARLVLAISLTVAVACGILGWFSIMQQRSVTRLALEQELKLQYQSVVAALDYEGRAAIAVSSVVASLPPVADAIDRGDRDALIALLGAAHNALKAQGMPRMMIALPPATVFLRIQDPKAYGDDASGRRTTIVTSGKTASQSSASKWDPRRSPSTA
jgi:methyl-accepting chemotaxis protein